MAQQAKGTSTRRPRRSSAASAKKPAAKPAPRQGRNSPRASVRVYRHGLGDCILVRIKRRGAEDFKLLIDCGVVTGSKLEKLHKAVENVIDVTGGSLDAVALTHEHWDHVSGFVDAREPFKKLSKVGEIWLAWTEDKSDELAGKVKEEMGAAKRALQKSALRFGASSPAAELLEDIAVMGSFSAASGRTTADAFENARMLSTTRRYWKPTDAPYEIKGANARIYALGPPRDIKKIRKINPTKSALETYGLALSIDGVMPFGLAAALEEPDQFLRVEGSPFHQRVTIPQEEAEKIPFFAETYFGGGDDWRRIDDDWLGPVNDFALALQSYTNNTSLVLAVELGAPGRGDVLLFAADAQVGNWLSWRDCAWSDMTGDDLLRRVIFYKVGHHGSHNATLKAEGLEKMVGLQAAVIPVDAEMAKKKRWGHMPLPDLIDELKKRVKDEGFFRTDECEKRKSEKVEVTDDYVELHF